MSEYLTIDSIYRDRVSYPNPCDWQLTESQVANWFKYAREVRALPQSANKRPLEFVTSTIVHSLTLPYPRVSLYATESILVTSIDVTGTIFTADSPLPSWFIVGASIQSGTNSNGITTYKTYFVNSILTPTTFTLDVVDPPVGPVVFSPGSNLNIPFYNYTASVEAELTDALQLLTYPRIYLNYYQFHDDNQLVFSIDSIHREVKFVFTHDRHQYDNQGNPIWIHYRCLFDQVMRINRDHPPVFRITNRSDNILPFFIDTDDSVPANPDKQMLIDISLTPYIRDAVYTNSTIETSNI